VCTVLSPFSIAELLILGFLLQVEEEEQEVEVCELSVIPSL